MFLRKQNDYHSPGWSAGVMVKVDRPLVLHVFEASQNWKYLLSATCQSYYFYDRSIWGIKVRGFIPACRLSCPIPNHLQDGWVLRWSLRCHWTFWRASPSLASIQETVLCLWIPHACKKEDIYASKRQRCKSVRPDKYTHCILNNKQILQRLPLILFAKPFNAQWAIHLSLHLLSI